MTRTPPVMPTEDYEAIEAAVMDTARGRWFLAEFARRNRTADTSLLLDAIGRLEDLLAADEAAPLALPKPHLPVASTALATSANAELFALDPLHPTDASFSLTNVPDDVAWVSKEDDAPETKFAPPDVFEIDDESLIWPTESVAPAPVLEPSTPAMAPAQSAMLAAALAHAGEAVARTAEPDVQPSPPGTSSPPAADPAELDALSFEEKSVYFA